MRKFFLPLLMGMLVLYSGCREKGETAVTVKTEESRAVQPAGKTGGVMRLTSSAFGEGDRIPEKYTADGEDISPPLYIEGVPEEAKALALIVDDPDAPVGTWDHWVIWNIPADTKEIKEGISPEGVSGKNDWGRLGYGGPAPPSGTHRYIFKLYALDMMLDLSEGAVKEKLEKEMKGHTLVKAVLIGIYSR